ncbi:MAG: HAMP domain-containing histidine kinase [Solirubrobacterales bacterium]|nr:HAMP domain-containing histidine kinase [Thermoleophilales bacterium]MCO5328050.1 HAMP domain-containing histidine kinase [Solirubrobacterales bacterium]
MSLSRRLVLILLAVSAVGLLALDLVSYAALRSYLSDRVDQQAVDALPLAGVILGGGMQGPSGGTGPEGQGGSGLPGSPGDAGGALPPPSRGEGGDLPGPQLPTGTYAEVRSADGEVLDSQTIGDSDAEPELPETVTAPADGTAGDPFDADSDAGGTGFRAVARATPSGGTLVVAIPLTELDDTLSRLRSIQIVVSFAILAALAALSLWAVRAGLRPLARMEETAGEIAAGDMSHRVEDTDPRTEVGRLGLAFNEMLARLEHAFAEQRASEERLRRFLADASHELRTPLSSIRGYAELFRMGAASDPNELEHAMGRIESESVRMSVLVEDLLALARLDEMREAQRERVDLAAILEEACADARTTAPDREIALELPAEGEGVLRGDPDALRQLAGNLIANAIRHGAGAVEVALGREGAELLLTVRDHGEGLPPGSEEDVFERFWRAGEARDRPSGGAGLGLAIVAGVAASHGATASAANAPGGGALFSVRFPA